MLNQLQSLTNTGVVLNNAAATGTLQIRGGTFWATIKDGVGKVAIVVSNSMSLMGTNSFTGGLIISNGTLTVAQPNFSPNLPVTINGGGMLNLLFTGTNQVKSLVLGGVTQLGGVYNSNTAPAYFTNSGSLLVPNNGPTGPASITNSIAGSTLTLKWPAGMGWRLVSQTNTLATGLQTASSAWFTVSGAGDGTATITVNPANPTVYYKLVYP